ncbi:YfjI family protein [Empedobacter falsenii]
MESNRVLRKLYVDFKNISGQNIFPLEIFPPKIQELILELKQTMNFPIDYSSCAILYAVSVAIGNKVQLKVKNGWIEKSILFIVLVGRTGDIKSHSISFFINDLFKIDQKNNSHYQQIKREYDKMAPEKKGDLKVPILTQLLLNDFTTEALVKSHYNNPRGVGLYSDEIAGFFKSFNKYHGGSGDEELYLSLWAGKPIVKNRSGGDEFRIDDTKIDIIGSIQEAILESTFKNSKMKNGFIDRFLFSFPYQYVNNKWNDRELEHSTIDWYSNFINKIYNEANKNDVLLEFDEQAKIHIFKWQNLDEMDFDFEYQRGIAVKLQQYVLRFSIVLEVINSFCEDKSLSKIDINTVISAIKLRDYFFETALKVFEKIDSNYYETLTETQKKVFNKLPSTFKTGEAIKMVCNSNLMKERSLKSFLNNRILFRKIDHGKYEKLII